MSIFCLFNYFTIFFFKFKFNYFYKYILLKKNKKFLIVFNKDGFHFISSKKGYKFFTSFFFNRFLVFIIIYIYGISIDINNYVYCCPEDFERDILQPHNTFINEVEKECFLSRDVLLQDKTVIKTELKKKIFNFKNIIESYQNTNFYNSKEINSIQSNTYKINYQCIKDHIDHICKTYGIENFSNDPEIQNIHRDVRSLIRRFDFDNNTIVLSKDVIKELARNDITINWAKILNKLRIYPNETFTDYSSSGDSD